MPTHHRVMSRRPHSIQWSEFVPKTEGIHTGKLYGLEFEIELETVKGPNRRSGWRYTATFYPAPGPPISIYENGPAGGISRALSVFRDHAESICQEMGVAPE